MDPIRPDSKGKEKLGAGKFFHRLKLLFGREKSMPPISVSSSISKIDFPKEMGVKGRQGYIIPFLKRSSVWAKMRDKNFLSNNNLCHFPNPAKETIPTQ